MLAILIAAVTILLISFARDVICSTFGSDSVRSDDDSGMLREILQRMDKMQNHMDRMQNHIDRIERSVHKIEANVLNMQDNSKNLSVVMETIVEQQMVITAEIFTVSQTLPFCCCQYQNTTDRPEIETTTIDTGKPETTTPTTTLTALPTNCPEAVGESGSDGIYHINVTISNISSFGVYCMKNIVDSEKEKVINGTWMIIQRRQDNTTDFYRNWDMYKRGFGDLNGNFWIGLDILYVLTKSTEQELWVQLEDFTGKRAWAKYSHFSIGSELEKYKLQTLGVYVGNASDSLWNHKNQMWSTYDKDNDNNEGNCARTYEGAWWYNTCFESNLNGIYKTNFMWTHFGYCKYSHMAVRPRK